MDPFSIIAGAAGFVSLGIHITKDLSEFCDDYRGRDEDFGTLSEEAAFLRDLVQYTERQLNSSDGFDKKMQESLYSLRQKVVDCQNASQKILYKMQRTNTGNWVQKQGSRLRYPLGPKRKLQDVLQQQQQFLGKINMLLAQSNINETIAARRSNEEASEQLFLLSGRHTEQMNQVLDSIKQCSKTEMLHSMEAKILAAISNRMVSDAGTWSKHGNYAVPLLGNDISTRHDLVSLRRQHHKRNIRPKQRSNQRLGKNFVCCCFASQDGRVLQANESTEFGRVVEHKRSCICYLAPTVVSKRISGDFTLFQRIVKWDIAISYSTRGMFQSLQVFPSLSIQGVVPRDSPAFQLLRETVPKLIAWREADIAVRHAQLRQCLRGIQELYITGKASPTDVTPDGHDLLSLTVSTMVDLMRDNPPPGTSYIDRIRNDLEREHELRRELISALQGFGMDVNNGKHLKDQSLMRGKTRHPPYLIESPESHSNWAAIVVALAECDFDVTYLEQRFWINVDQLTHGCGALTIYELMETVIEPLYGELSQAVIKRDENQLSKILQLRPHSISERDANEDTPFHIATRWPRGLDLLLRTEASLETRRFSNAPNMEGRTPLLLAVIDELTESCELLIEADVAIDDSSWFLVAVGRNKELATLFAKGLVRRRLQFHELFKSIYPESGKTAEACVNESIDKALQLLQKRGVYVAPALKESYSGPLYALDSQRPPCVEILDALHESGVRDVDVRDGRGRTLLGRLVKYLNAEHMGAIFIHHTAALRSFSENGHAAILWLLEHGADIETGASFIKDKHKILHWLPIELSLLNVYGRLVSMTGVQRRSEALFRTYLNKIGRSGCHGPCRCPCAQRPCAPVLIYSRIQLEQAHLIATPQGTHARKAWKWDKPRMEYGGITGSTLFGQRYRYPYVDSSHFLAVIQFLSDAHGKTMSPEALRLATFQRLGLRHTCCLWRPSYPEGSPSRFPIMHHLSSPSTEEIFEIQEEQAALTNDLEDLMDEFEAAMQDHEGDMIDFLLGFWWERMDKYENDVCTAQVDEEALRDLGIVLMTDDNDEAF